MRVPNGADSGPDLPDGWVRARLDDIAEINPGMDLANLPNDLEVSFVPMPAVEALSGRMVASAVRPLADVRKGYTRFKEGDVLFAKITPCMENGKIAIARNLRNRIGFGSTEFHVVRTAAGVSNEYVRLFMTRDSFRREAEHNFKGTAGQRRVPAAFLVRSTVPLPPEAEQHRVVAKVDELFSDLDAGVANLKRARALLEKYRQAVLKPAVTGELTREWREKRGAPTETGAELLQRILKARRESWEAAELAKMRARGRAPRDDGWKRKYKEPEPPDRSNLPKLPDGWIWASLDQLSWSSSYGTSVKCDYSFSGEAVLRIPNIRPGILDHRDLKRALRSLGTTDHGYLRAGDMLIIRTNGSLDWLGQAVVLQQNLTERTYFASYLIRFRIVEDLPLWKWINVFWQTQLVRNWIRHHAATSAGQYNVSQSSLARAPVPIPATAEIVAALERVDDLTTFLVPVEDDLRAALRASSSLRQAILTSAFCGALVAQHPDDEPASVLLERIRAERTAEPKPARGRRRGAGAGGRQLELLG